MNDSPQKSLDERLADLPRDIAPPRNLWPGITRRLHRSPRRASPLVFAAAAGVACACVASALTWAVLQGRPASPATSAAVRATTFDEPRNPRYVAARDSLEVNFRERLRLLAQSELFPLSCPARRHHPHSCQAARSRVFCRLRSARAVSRRPARGRSQKSFA